MSTESAANRRRKRIVEHTIDGFTNASTAIIFGNTVERLVKDKIGAQKFRQYIGAPDISLAITPEWIGPTVLKTTFLELEDDEVANFICDQFSRTLKTHNDVHRASIKITSKIVRGKPQPQFIG
jgi:hypothetical protein